MQLEKAEAGKKKLGAGKAGRPPGQELTGAAGTSTAAVDIRRDMQAMAKAEEIMEASVRAQANEYVPGAIDTLGSFSTGQSVNGIDPKDTTVRQSARDVIEFAFGRPETREPSHTDSSQQIHIYIQRFGDGQLIKAVDGSVIDVDTSNPFESAERLVNDISRTYEVADEDKPGETP